MVRTNHAQQAIPIREMAIFWGPVLVWMALIFIVSSINTWTVFEGPPLLKALRKGAHIFEYSVLALLLGRAIVSTAAMRGERITRPLLAFAWWVGASLSAVYAITDEIHQGLVPGRKFHVGDIAIDALAAVAALGIWYIVRSRRLALDANLYNPEQH